MGNVSCCAFAEKQADRNTNNIIALNKLIKKYCRKDNEFREIPLG